MITSQYRSQLFIDYFQKSHEKLTDAKQFPLFLEKYGKNVLEIGIGLGRIAIPLAEAGFHVVGIENSPIMIQKLEEKLHRESNIVVIESEARSFNLNRKFDSVILTCNFINQILDIEELQEILLQCKDHLRKGGGLVIDGTVPILEFMVQTNGKEETTEYLVENGKIIRFLTPLYDFINQTCIQNIRFEKWVNSKLVCTEEIEASYTYYFPREIHMLLRFLGFSIISEGGNIPIKGRVLPPEKTGGMVFCCEL